MRRSTEKEVIASRVRCKALATFIKEAWHIIHPTGEAPEPLDPNELGVYRAFKPIEDRPPPIDGINADSQKYVHNWHIDLICAHLEAITYGRFKKAGLENRLLIEQPPGTMKSLLVNVFWTAWEWGPAGLPFITNIATSYREKLCERDARRTRDLILSKWYRDRWPTVKLVRAGETSFENNSRGTYEAVPFKSLTGGRAHRVKIDDPHSVATAESDADRLTITTNFKESVPLRLIDPRTSAIVVTMQRLNERDTAGTIRELQLPYTIITLPMEYDPKRKCKTPFGEDPRTIEGELLFPERFPREVVDRDKKNLGSFATAAQLQQKPTSREGNLFKREWFANRFVDEVPVGTVFVRHWDLAGTTDPMAPRSAGVKMGKTPAGRFIVADCDAIHKRGAEVRKRIQFHAEMDGVACEVSLPQDPGQAGLVQAQDFKLFLAGFKVITAKETGSKEDRAEPFAIQCEAGNVDILRGPWNKEYLDELCDFPAGRFKDRVDASSGAFGRLTLKKSGRQFGVI